MPAAATARVVDAALVRGQHFNQHVRTTQPRRVELAPLLALGTGELGEEVFVDAAQDVLGVVGSMGFRWIGVRLVFCGFPFGHKFDRANQINQFAQPLLVQGRTGVVLRQCALQTRIVALDGLHGIVDQLADRGLFGAILEFLPASFLGHPEDVFGPVFIGIFGIGTLIVPNAGDQLRMMLFEGIRDVLQEDQAQHGVLVFGRVHVVPQLIRRQPHLGLEAQIGRGILLLGRLFLSRLLRHSADFRKVPLQTLESNRKWWSVLVDRCNARDKFSDEGECAAGCAQPNSMSANRPQSDQIQGLIRMAGSTPLTGTKTTAGSISFKHPELPPALLVVWYRHQFDAAFRRIRDDHVFEIEDLNGDCMNIDPCTVVDFLLDQLPTLASRIRQEPTDASLKPIATMLDARDTASRKLNVFSSLDLQSCDWMEVFYGHIYEAWCDVRQHWIELELEVLSDLGARSSVIPEGATREQRPGVAEALAWSEATTVGDLLKDPWWIDHATTLLYEPHHAVPDHLHDLLTELDRVFVGTQHEPEVIPDRYVVTVPIIVKYLNRRHGMSGSAARKLPIAGLLALLRQDDEPFALLPDHDAAHIPTSPRGPKSNDASPNETTSPRHGKGEAEAIIIAGLIEHHGYSVGKAGDSSFSVSRNDPINVGEFAKNIGVGKQTVSDFLKKWWPPANGVKSHRQYAFACQDSTAIALRLALMNGDATPSRMQTNFNSFNLSETTS